MPVSTGNNGTVTSRDYPSASLRCLCSRVVGSEFVYAVFCVRFYFISAKVSSPHHGWWWGKLLLCRQMYKQYQKQPHRLLPLFSGRSALARAMAPSCAPLSVVPDECDSTVLCTFRHRLLRDEQPLEDGVRPRPRKPQAKTWRRATTLQIQRAPATTHRKGSAYEKETSRGRYRQRSMLFTAFSITKLRG